MKSTRWDLLGIGALVAGLVVLVLARAVGGWSWGEAVSFGTAVAALLCAWEGRRND